MLIIDHLTEGKILKQDQHKFYSNDKCILKIYTCFTIPSIGEKIKIKNRIYVVDQIIYEPELIEVRYYLKLILD